MEIETRFGSLCMSNRAADVAAERCAAEELIPMVTHPGMTKRSSDSPSYAAQKLSICGATRSYMDVVRVGVCQICDTRRRRP